MCHNPQAAAESLQEPRVSLAVEKLGLEVWWVACKWGGEQMQEGWVSFLRAAWFLKRESLFPCLRACLAAGTEA